MFTPIARCSLVATLLLLPSDLVAEVLNDGPGFRAADGQPPALQSTRVDFVVAGPIARMNLHQVYVNDTAVAVDSAYVFPVPADAAVHAMRLTAGDRIIEARIAERAAARAAFEAARDRGDRAALLEQQRPNVMVTEVANIGPGARVEVEIEYTQLVRPTAGVMELRVPTAVGKRYSGEGAWERWLGLPSGGPAWEASGLIQSGLPVADLRSPTHRYSLRSAPEGGVGVRFEPAESPRDLVLQWRIGQRSFGAGASVHRTDRETYFMIELAPPERPAPSATLPREVVVVLDVSGSMHGAPLAAAKRVVKRLLDNLRPVDRFNLATFAGEEMVLFARSVPPEPGLLEYVDRVLAGMRGAGGTRLLQALDRVMALPRDEARMTTYVLVTDGHVTVEPEVYRLVRERRGRAAAFALGVGSSPNAALLGAVARAGGGEMRQLGDGLGLEDQVDAFARALEQPLLSDVVVEASESVELEWARVPVLFADRPQFILGRLPGAPRGAVRVRGLSGGGEREWTFDLEHATEVEAPLYPKLWARRRLARLTDLEALGQDQRAEITAVALAHDLMSPYTSFVAVEGELAPQLTGRADPPEPPRPGVGCFGKRSAPRLDAPRRSADRQNAINSGLLGMLKGGDAATSNVFGPGASGLGGAAATGRGAGGGGYGRIDLGGRGKGAANRASPAPGELRVEAVMVVDGARSSASAETDVRRQLQFAIEAEAPVRVVVELDVEGTGAVREVRWVRASGLRSDVRSRLERELRGLRFRPHAGEGSSRLRVVLVGG